jgi:hypothetical protein
VHHDRDPAFCSQCLLLVKQSPSRRY